jgi:hypothetical protein
VQNKPISSIDQLGRHRIRNRKIVCSIPIDWYIEDLEELFVSQMLTIDNVFSALLLSVDGLCEN